MNTLQSREEFFPSVEDVQVAKSALDSLSISLKDAHGDKEAFDIWLNKKTQPITIPTGILELLVEALQQAAKGNSITITPSNKEFTTQEAADFLNVSRPFVIKLLNQGEIPYRRVGKHRRISVQELMSYKQRSDQEAMKAFEELAKLTQELK